MRVTVVVAVVLVLVSTALLAVSYANPEFVENHPEVDLDDEPSQLAHDAIMNLRSHDYTHTASLKGTNETPLRNNYMIENTNERYTILNGDSPYIYANEGMGWTYDDVSIYSEGIGTVRRQLFNRDYSSQILYRESVANPDIDATKADWYVVNENESTVVLRTDTPANFTFSSRVLRPWLFDPDSHIDLHIDKEEERATRLVIKEATAPVQEPHRYVVHKFSDFGETTVERPKAAPRFSLNEVVYRTITDHRSR